MVRPADDFGFALSEAAACEQGRGDISLQPTANNNSQTGACSVEKARGIMSDSTAERQDETPSC